MQEIGDLARHAFLHLQAPRKHIDHARNLAEAQHFAARNVGHVRYTIKGQHMMLAQAVILDVFDDDHFVVSHFE